jgi:hypothetical protein
LAAKQVDAFRKARFRPVKLFDFAGTYSKNQ